MNAITDLSLFRAPPKRSMPVGTHALAVSTMLAWQLVPLLGGPLILPHPATHVIVHSYWPSLPGSAKVQFAVPLQPASLLARAKHQSLVMFDCDDWLEEHLPPGLIIQRLPTGGTPRRLAGLVPQLVDSPTPPETSNAVAVRLAHLACNAGFGAEGEAPALASTALHLRDVTLRWPMASGAERASLATALRKKLAIPAGEWPDDLADLERLARPERLDDLLDVPLLARFVGNMLGAVPPGLVRMLGRTLADGRVPSEPDDITDEAGLPPSSETWPLSLSHVLLPLPATRTGVPRAVLQFRADPAS